MISTACTFLYGATRSATNLAHVLGRDRTVDHHERLWYLAGLLVGPRDHCRVGDRRVRQQQRFEFCGRDLVLTNHRRSSVAAVAGRPEAQPASALTSLSAPS